MYSTGFILYQEVSQCAYELGNSWELCRPAFGLSRKRPATKPKPRCDPTTNDPDNATQTAACGIPNALVGVAVSLRRARGSCGRTLMG